MVHLSCLYCSSNQLQEKTSAIKNTKRFCCGACNQEFVVRWVPSDLELEKKTDLVDIASDIECVHCNGNKIQKNGILKWGWQRYKCLTCSRHFTVGGIRGTYDDDFKVKIADFYINRKISARKLARKYNISTSTIVTWGKMYRAWSSSNWFVGQ